MRSLGPYIKMLQVTTATPAHAVQSLYSLNALIHAHTFTSTYTQVHMRALSHCLVTAHLTHSHWKEPVLASYGRPRHSQGVHQHEGSPYSLVNNNSTQSPLCLDWEICKCAILFCMRCWPEYRVMYFDVAPAATHFYRMFEQPNRSVARRMEFFVVVIWRPHVALGPPLLALVQPL